MISLTHLTFFLVLHDENNNSKQVWVAADRDTSSEKSLLVFLLVEFIKHTITKKKKKSLTESLALITSCFIILPYLLHMKSSYKLYMRLRLESDH
jgi:hypothetical protein